MKKYWIVVICLLVGMVPCIALAMDNDYTKMRLEFAARPDFNPYVIQTIEKALVGEAMTAWRKGDAITTFKKFNEALQVYPVSIEVNRRMADGYKNLIKNANKEQKKELAILEDKHRTLAEGLIKSIISSGNGKTQKTAFTVITIPEEYMTLWYLGLAIEKIETENENEVTAYDVFTAKNHEGLAQKVYFDVSIMKKSFNRQTTPNKAVER